jgi:WD40 repeat protein
VKLWNGTTGALARSITVGSLVYAVALSPDGKRVAAGSFDGLVRLYDDAGRHLVTLLSLPPAGDAADWLAMAPAGYVAGTKELLKQARWSASRQAVPADKAAKVLRRADLVARALKGDALPTPTFGK